MNFKNCSVIIYDAYGVPLKNAKVLVYDATEKYIEVLKSPEFYSGMECGLIILSEPAPYFFSGVIRSSISNTNNVMITLFKGKVKEGRTAKRFKLTGEAAITHYIDNKKYDLHTHIKVHLMNISVSGVRLIAQENTMSNADQFNLKLEIAGNEKILETKVINSNKSTMIEGCTEYGCCFLGDGNG